MIVRRGTPVVLLALLLVLLLGGCGGGSAPVEPIPGSGPAAPPTSSGPSSTEPPRPPTSGTGDRVALPVYYAVDTPAGFRLQREFHRVMSADAGSDAVREMLASPTGNDPDYRSHWPAGTALRAPVRMADGAIVVDLSGVAGAQVGTELAEVTVQQLVYTVQGALQATAPVRILQDGQPVDELWGAVATDQPVARGDAYAFRSLVQIDAPANGSTVERTFEVTGEAAVFEATVAWELLRGAAVVQSGFTSTSEGQRFSPYAFELTAEPGEYTLRVLEDDPSDGEGRASMADTKAITVAA